MPKMPLQKPGHSRQDYGTPPELLNAIRKRLDILDFEFDLAADETNTVVSSQNYGGDIGLVKNHFNIEDNSLTKDWHKWGGPKWMWLNPPFANITPWVEKAYKESKLGAHIVVLVPTSFAEWWRDWVEGKCYITNLQGRVKFVGCPAAYPKDISILLYTPWGFRGSEVWDWK